LPARFIGLGPRPEHVRSPTTYKDASSSKC
jgi:hypothetical protein